MWQHSVLGAGVSALGNRRIMTVALSSMPQEAQLFGTGPFCSWVLEPCMPGLHSVPDCQADPMCVASHIPIGWPTLCPWAADAVIKDVLAAPVVHARRSAHLLRFGNAIFAVPCPRVDTPERIAVGRSP